MKLPTFALLLTLLLAAALITTALASSASDFNLWWHVVASGGGLSTSSGYAANGTIGQPVVGASSGGDFHLRSGFWHGVAAPAPPPGHPLYLPVVLKPPP